MKNNNKGKAPKEMLVKEKIYKPVPKAKPQAKSRPRKARFNLGLESLDAGPFSIKGFSASSDKRMVGLASHSMNAQVVMPRITSTRRSRDGAVVDILEGTDLVASVNTTGASAGDILVEQFINPSAFEGTRMAQYSPLYQRYRFLSIEFMFQPTAAATESGQVIGFCTFDPDAPLPASDPLNVNKAAAFFGNRQNQVWEFATYGQHQLDSMTDLYVDAGGADIRFSFQGIFYLIAASSLGSIGAVGQIYCRYKLEMQIPQLQFGIGSPASATGTITNAHITSGTLSAFGDTITQDAGGQLDVVRVSASQIRISGVVPGALLVFSSGAAMATGSGGALSAQGGTLVWSGATIQNSNSVTVCFNTSNADYALTSTALVTATTGSVTLSYTASVTGITTTTSSGAFFSAVMLPVTAASALASKRVRDAEIDEICTLFRLARQDKSEAREVFRVLGGKYDPHATPAGDGRREPLSKDPRRESYPPLRTSADADHVDRGYVLRRD